MGVLKNKVDLSSLVLDFFTYIGKILSRKVLIALSIRDMGKEFPV